MPLKCSNNAQCFCPTKNAQKNASIMYKSLFNFDDISVLVNFLPKKYKDRVAIMFSNWSQFCIHRMWQVNISLLSGCLFGKKAGQDAAITRAKVARRLGERQLRRLRCFVHLHLNCLNRQATQTSCMWILRDRNTFQETRINTSFNLFSILLFQGVWVFGVSGLRSEFSGS